MKVNFKVPRSLDGVNYPKGIHTIPDSLASHWYFLAMVQNGNAVVLEAPSKIAPEVPATPEKIPEKAPEAPSTPNYHEHMKQWESEQDKKNAKTEKVETVEQPNKRKDAAAKAAATRAANKAKLKEVAK